MNYLYYYVGKIASKIRSCYYYYIKQRVIKQIHLGTGTSISGETDFSCPENIYIGNHTYINRGGVFSASKKSSITIGDNCLISYNVFMRTETHLYQDKSMRINEQGLQEKDIVIGNDVWIGYGAMISAGVKIADGCVIGCNAVVTHDTEPYGVYVGAPAKRVKERN